MAPHRWDNQDPISMASQLQPAASLTSAVAVPYFQLLLYFQYSTLAMIPASYPAIK